MKKFFVLLGLGLSLPSVGSAHCPLCTAGAGILAITAARLGVNVVVVGVLVGAFALALSLWLPKLVKKQYFARQSTVLAVVIFLSTIIPIMPFIREFSSINIFLFGPYGSWFNRTYMFDTFLVGSILGAGIMLCSPSLSQAISRARGGKLWQYQGITLTFSLLVVTSILIQIAL
jgi:hypothetical protein